MNDRTSNEQSIVERLRTFDWYGPPRKGADELLNEAALVIEGLQRELAIATATIADLEKDIGAQFSAPDRHPGPVQREPLVWRGLLPARRLR